MQLIADALAIDVGWRSASTIKLRFIRRALAGHRCRRRWDYLFTTRCMYVCLETIKPCPAYWALKVLIGAAVAGRLLNVTSDGSRIEPAPGMTSAIMEALKASPLEPRTRSQMKRYEWKSLLLLEWDRWLQTESIEPPAPTAKDTLKFFCELQDRRSPLLDFRPRRHDKWRVIHALLLSEERVSD